MKHFKHFLGQDYFEVVEEINAAAEKRGLSVNLKVKNDVIEGTNIPLLDFVDISVDDNRLTVTIDKDGEILTLKRG